MYVYRCFYVSSGSILEKTCLAIGVYTFHMQMHIVRIGITGRNSGHHRYPKSMATDCRLDSLEGPHRFRMPY